LEPEQAPITWEARYHSPDEGAALFAAWAARDAERVQLLPWGTSAGGVAIIGLEFAAMPLGHPGPAGSDKPGAENGRPRVYLIGGLDGRSLVGAEAVLRVTAGLLENPDRLPPDIVFVSVPWASVDGLLRLRQGAGRSGANGAPRDEDGDGRVDEDGPDDLDGDGLVSSMLIADSAGPWVRSSDQRFLRPARPGEGPRYLLLAEGRDDDGDGRFNEDGVGGVRADLNFPLGWDGLLGHPLAGDLPLAAPESRALAEHVLAGPTAAVLLFSGEHGGIAFPGGTEESPWPADADAALWDRLTASFAFATGRKRDGEVPLGGSLRSLSGARRPGAALDWIYGVAGVMTMELSPWGPRLLAPGGGQPLPGSFRRGGGANGNGISSPTAPGAEDLAWAHWLDNVRGGIGFLDWHPVDLGENGGGLRVLVGGWEPRTRLNPPVEELERATAGLTEFVASLARDLPRLSLRVLHVEREGEWVRLRARLENSGSLPARLWPTGRWRAQPGTDALLSSPVVLEIDLPLGAELLAGEPRILADTLPASDAGPEGVWLLRSKPGAVFTLRGSAPGCRTVEREVRP
jgi:hypothetical protein